MLDTDKMMFRRGVALPPGLGLGHETDSELGHGADNDSLASFLSSVHGMTSHDMDNVTSHDMIPTRDSGLMAPRDAEFDTASFHSSNTMTTPQNTRKMSDKQPRSISRVYLSSADEPIGGKSWRREGEEPRLMSWRRTTTHEDSNLVSRPGQNQGQGGPGGQGPPLPARKPSAAGDNSGAPNRPPKPRSNNNTDDEECRKDKDSNNSDSSIWYEYGCV